MMAVAKNIREFAKRCARGLRGVARRVFPAEVRGSGYARFAGFPCRSMRNEVVEGNCGSGCRDDHSENRPRLGSQNRSSHSTTSFVGLLGIFFLSGCPIERPVVLGHLKCFPAAGGLSRMTKWSHG